MPSATTAVIGTYTTWACTTHEPSSTATGSDGHDPTRTSHETMTNANHGSSATWLLSGSRMIVVPSDQHSRREVAVMATASGGPPRRQPTTTASTRAVALTIAMVTSRPAGPNRR